jgi:hypothetical protein
VAEPGWGLGCKAGRGIERGKVEEQVGWLAGLGVDCLAGWVAAGLQRRPHCGSMHGGEAIHPPGCCRANRAR